MADDDFEAMFATTSESKSPWWSRMGGVAIATEFLAFSANPTRVCVPWLQNKIRVVLVPGSF